MPRRLLVILIIIGCLVSVVVFLFKPAIVLIVQKQLEGVFKQARVSIGGCDIEFARQVTLSDIDIERQGDYKIEVEQAGVSYNLFSLLDPASRKLFLENPEVYLNTPQKGIADFFSSLNLKSGKSVLGAAEISGLNLDVNTKDLTLKAVFSGKLNLVKQWPESLELNIYKLDIFGLKLEDAVLRADPSMSEGYFSVTGLKYDKLGISDIRGTVELGDMKLVLSDITGRMLNGDIKGDLELSKGKEVRYAAHIRGVALDIATLVLDFEWQDKFEMSGKLSGDLELKGSGVRLEKLEGNFSALAPGGELLIKDAKFLDNMAQNAQKPLDLLVESFRNYSYNTGMAVAGLQDGNIVLNVDLRGEAGKRNLNIILHDFKLGGIE